VRPRGRATTSIKGRYESIRPEASDQLGEEFDGAVPNVKSEIAQEMAKLNSELFASKTLLEHSRVDE
jgi:hypothetical protein